MAPHHSLHIPTPVLKTRTCTNLFQTSRLTDILLATLKYLVYQLSNCDHPHCLLMLLNGLYAGNMEHNLAINTTHLTSSATQNPHFVRSRRLRPVIPTMLRKYREISGNLDIPSSSSSSSLIDDINASVMATSSATPFPNNKRSPSKPPAACTNIEQTPMQRAQRVLRKTSEFHEIVSSHDNKNHHRKGTHYKFDEVFDTIFAKSDDEIDSD